MKIKFLSFILLLLFYSFVWSQTDNKKTAFLNYKDSCNAKINKLCLNKDYDTAIKTLNFIKNRYDKLDRKTRKEMNLEGRFFYAYATYYSYKNDEKSTMKNLKKVVHYNYNRFDPYNDNIYSIYKDNPAFAKTFIKLLELSRYNQRDTISLPWHLTDIQTHLKQNINLEKLEIDFSILSDIPRDLNLYISSFYGHINNHGFYGGVQTKVNGTDKPGLIFSRWDEQDKRAIKTDSLGYTCSSGNEGDFISVRKPFEWSKGRYKISLTADTGTFILNGKIHRWVTMRIYSYDTKQEFINGSLAFPGDTLTLDKNLSLFVEVYGMLYENKLAISTIPEMQFSFDRFIVNGQEQVNSGEAYFWPKYPKYADVRYKNGKIFVTAGKKFSLRALKFRNGFYVEPLFDVKN
jgi:hypothetical protein